MTLAIIALLAFVAIALAAVLVRTRRTGRDPWCLFADGHAAQMALSAASCEAMAPVCNRSSRLARLAARGS